jgi:hypothetical protein
MSDPISAILGALFGEDDFPTPYCAECRNQLGAYVEAGLAGLDAAARFPAVGAHLAACADCRQAHDELRALLSMPLAEPPVRPHFDFSYLPAATIAEEATARPWRLDALGRLIIQFSADLLRGLQGPALQPSYLKGAAAEPVEYALPAPVGGLNVHIRAEPDRRDPGRLHVAVEVAVAGRSWPDLAGSVVSLARGGEELEKQETDAFGVAVFEDVPAEALPELRFEIGTAPAPTRG